MRKFLLKNRIKNAFPVVIKSLLGPPTTVTVPVLKGIEVWEYQFTSDVYIKQQNGILELKLIEDYTNKQNTEVPEVKLTQPIVEKPIAKVAEKPARPAVSQEKDIVSEKKSKRGRPSSKVAKTEDKPSASQL